MSKSTEIFCRVTVYVFLATMTIIFIAPFYLIVVNSFKPTKEIFSNMMQLPQNFTTENFSKAYKDLNYLNVFKNSLIVTVVANIGKFAKIYCR